MYIHFRNVVFYQIRQQVLELSDGSQRLVKSVMGLGKTIPSKHVELRQWALYAMENLNSDLDQMRILNIS